MQSIESVISTITRDTRLVCPNCSGNRKKKSERSLSVTVKADALTYYCHHCNAGGAIQQKKFYEEYMNAPVTKIPTQLNYNVDLIKRFFLGRGVNLDDINSLPAMTTGVKWIGDREQEAVGFIYGDRERPDAIKWRSIEGKGFTSDNAPRAFYGRDAIDPDAEELIIVEGECDVIALASIGIKAVSCPNGAPAKVSSRRVSPEDDGRFGYIWEERELIDKAKKIILATDNDNAGEALAEEIARRVGRAKCWRVKFPEGVKDANDAVRSLGKEQTSELFAKPEPVPLSGVYSAESYRDDIVNLFNGGSGRGESTGFDSIDELYTVAEGQMTVVTGIPSSGKSEFVDQLMINLARKSNWRFAVCSFENPPAYHIAKMAEKVIGKPFYEGHYTKMDQTELNQAIEFINDRFCFLESKDGGLSTVESIIDRTKQAVMRLGVRGLVIDPFNYIAMGSGDTNAISDMLSRLVSFAKSHGIHIWFIAHPTKLYPREDGSYPVPNGMTISGSAAWFAKADMGVTIHRTPECVEFHCWKSRFKHVGKQGVAFLAYDIATGTYREASAPVKDKPLADKYAKSVDWESFDEF